MPLILATLHRSSFLNKTKAILLVSLLSLTNTQLFAEEGFSEVNNALFDSPHMQSIKVEGKLNYLYQRSGDKQAIKEDHVTVGITNIHKNGHVDQTYVFFTSENKKVYPPRKNIRGNGIFMMFLERDVRQLEQQTEGSWRHFQRRIRWAMAAGADKKNVEITYQGKKIKGLQYRIQPYADDKKSKRYGNYANKYYLFTLSDRIPGTIYEVRTIVPKDKIWKEGDKVIVDERITFKDFIPNQKN